jgi:histidyl-tRNA synthetase
MEKPNTPPGFRDFSPEETHKRIFIFDTIQKVFQKFGFQPLETPAVEKLSVLTGKYGEEGDQLIFKILNSGDFLKDVTSEQVEKGYKSVTTQIAEKALRYDLTVPFARWVVQNRHLITFPFKRYQMQPVWRADRPQKGRYREFYQCDADVVGTESLLCEAEIVLMITEVLTTLGIQDFTIKINNRKILAGIAEVVGAAGKEAELCVAIDKLDKIGKEKVEAELLERGFSAAAIQQLQPLFEAEQHNTAQLDFLTEFLSTSEVGKKGIQELKSVFNLLNYTQADTRRLQLDITLARGLSYYTGAIFEVKANNVQIGSISGGGRYDNLTGLFGLPDVSGVGISFGVDRIYDVMNELQLFPQAAVQSTQVLLIYFTNSTLPDTFRLLQTLRQHNIKAEIYPDAAKLKKQFAYADKKQIPITLTIGDDEKEQGVISYKNMQTGEQEKLSEKELLERLLALKK